MLVLSSTTDTLKVVLGGAVTTNQLQVIASYRDLGTTVFEATPNVAVTNNTTPVNIVPAPASGNQHVIDFFSVYNADTAAATVTVNFDANGTTYTLFKGSIGIGEMLQYQEGQGVYVLANTGARKTLQSTASGPASSGQTTVVMNSDVVNNNAVANTLQDVTGLLFPVVAGSLYEFTFKIFYDAAATTTGSRWSINGPATTILAYTSDYYLSATSRTTNNASAYNIPAASNTTSATTGNVAYIQGFVNVSVDGDIQAVFASEIANSAITAKAGSFVNYRAIA
jgi:hypothetical protein